MMALLLLVPLATAGSCNKDCDPHSLDVFGCCPENPLTPLPRAHVDVAVPVVRVEPGQDGPPPFWIAKTETTQALYQSVLTANPARDPTCGTDCPVEGVSWCDAVAFANRLSAREWRKPAYRVPDGFRAGLDAATCRLLAPSVILDATGDGWRLPTVQEWTTVSSGPAIRAEERGEYAWYASNADDRAHPACGKREDAHGLCDVLGNVREWSSDRSTCGSGLRTAGTKLQAPGCVATDPATSDGDLGFRLVRSR